MVRAGIPLKQVVSEREEHLETERRLFKRNCLSIGQALQSPPPWQTLWHQDPPANDGCVSSFSRASVKLPSPPPDPGIDQGGTNLSLATSHTRLAI